ncbi:50S ribosomal protein L32 [Candidatus Roizmanbacteria bacterium]|nr:50S ribosomal protein L32 [Candidatus Roizmanbacteria bacterium]
MTPLPKRRHSTQRQGKRRAAIRLTLPVLVRCAQCEQLILPHQVCSHCGYYRGKDVLHLEERKESTNKSTKSSKQDSQK